MTLVTGTVHTAYYDWGGRKYIELLTEDSSVLRIKIPFRYGRVMAKIVSADARPIQSVQKGEHVKALVEHKYWDGDPYWILHSLTLLESGAREQDNNNK